MKKKDLAESLVKTIESEIDGYNVGFNYNGQGDYKIFLNT